jgi:hypothetical protein
MGERNWKRGKEKGGDGGKERREREWGKGERK